MKHTPLRSHCPINFALESFGDKWTLLIVRDLVFYGKRTYSEFLQSEEHIATNILADRLAHLVREGIVRKAAHPDDNRKELFLLTEKGLDLIPLLLQIEAWSSRHDADTTVPHAFAKRIHSDFDQLCRELRESAMQGQAAAIAGAPIC